MVVGQGKSWKFATQAIKLRGAARLEDPATEKYILYIIGPGKKNFPRPGKVPKSSGNLFTFLFLF